MISAVINVRNGMPMLDNALRSVRTWVDEVIVVDMASTDGSAEHSRHLGAQVFHHEPVGYVEPARAFAVAKASGDWVLIVDADEVIPRTLSHQLMRIAGEDEFDIVSIPEENWMFGAPIMHSGWQPDADRHSRFFRRGSLEFPTTLHAIPTPTHGSRLFDLPYSPGVGIVHFTYPTIASFVERMNRYTSVEASASSTTRAPSVLRDGLRDAAREFKDRYVHGGIRRSGWQGSSLVTLMAMYRLLVVLKTRERLLGLGDGVFDRYESEARRLLTEYGETSGS